MMGDRSLTLNVAQETLAALERLATETGRSTDQLAEEALERYVGYEGWKTEKIKQAIRRADAGEFATEEEIEATFERYRHASEPE